MTEPGIFAVMYTTRSLRRLKPDPVPDEVIYRVLDAAIRAPSGGNTQHWRFLVVKDPQVKQQVQHVYHKGWNEVQALYRNRPVPEHMGEEKFRRLLAAATYLAEHLAEVPVLLFACLKGTPSAAVTRCQTCSPLGVEHLPGSTEHSACLPRAGSWRDVNNRELSVRR